MSSVDYILECRRSPTTAKCHRSLTSPRETSINTNCAEGRATPVRRQDTRGGHWLWKRLGTAAPRLPSTRRPHYRRHERMDILWHAARYGLSVEETAHIFAIGVQTVLNWRRVTTARSSVPRQPPAPRALVPEPELLRLGLDEPLAADAYAFVESGVIETEPGRGAMPANRTRPQRRPSHERISASTWHEMIRRLGAML